MRKLPYAVLPVTVALLAAAAVASTAPASADPAPKAKDHFAVIGDVPYGADQVTFSLVPHPGAPARPLGRRRPAEGRTGRRGDRHRLGQVTGIPPAGPHRCPGAGGEDHSHEAMRCVPITPTS